jgi:hypothetical protein
MLYGCLLDCESHQTLSYGGGMAGGSTAPGGRVSSPGKICGKKSNLNENNSFSIPSF